MNIEAVQSKRIKRQYFEDEEPTAEKIKKLIEQASVTDSNDTEQQETQD